MVELSNLFGLMCAQAQLTYLLVKAELSRPLREVLAKRSPRLEYFVNCPICVGVWTAGVVVGIETLGWSAINSILAVSFAGSVAYELRAKHAACAACESTSPPYKWRVVK